MKPKAKRAVRNDDSDFLSIDPLQLDRDCVEQPERYFRYATRLADARLAYEESRTRQEVIEAEVDAEIRERPKKFGLKNVTEAAIKARIKTVEAYTDAVSEVLRLKHEVDILQAAVTALDHRKRMIEKLVDLHGQNYFSEPRVPENSKTVIDEMRKRKARQPLEDDDD